VLELRPVHAMNAGTNPNSNMMLVIHNTFLHAVELEDRIGLVRSKSEPAGCCHHAIGANPGDQIHELSEAQTTKYHDTRAQLDYPSDVSKGYEPDFEQLDAQQAPVQIHNFVTLASLGTSRHGPEKDCHALIAQWENCTDPAKTLRGCCKKSSPLSTTSTSASSDDDACEQNDAAPWLLSKPWVTNVAVQGNVPTQNSGLMSKAHAGTTLGSWTQQAALMIRTAQPVPVAGFQLSSAPSSFLGVATPKAQSPMAVDPMVLNTSTPLNDLPLCYQHRFHQESHNTGWLSDDARQFTKTRYNGRLSIITEDRVHTSGVLQYAVQFTAGQISSADGVGFIFSSRLPSTKNIQHIVSIFASSAGRICFRAGAEVIRSGLSLQCFKRGDWITMSMDLNQKVACFRIFSSVDGKPSSPVSFAFGSILEALREKTNLIPETPCGYFTCVVKNLDVSVGLGS